VHVFKICLWIPCFTKPKTVTLHIMFTRRVWKTVLTLHAAREMYFLLVLCINSQKLITCRYKMYNNKRNSTTQSHSVHLLIFLYVSVPLPILFLPVSGWFVAALQLRCILPLCESQNVRTDCQKWHLYDLEISVTHVYKTGISSGEKTWTKGIPNYIS
jgi:hypothetical protein